MSDTDAAQPHVYLSTGCLHGNHDYCSQSRVEDSGAYGQVRYKRPAECKFCGAPCVCPCHGEGTE